MYGSDRKENVMRARKSSDWADELDWADEIFNTLKIQVASETSNDRLYLLEHENTTADFDNGYDAEKIFDNPKGPQIYASLHSVARQSTAMNLSMDNMSVSLLTMKMNYTH